MKLKLKPFCFFGLQSIFLLCVFSLFCLRCERDFSGIKNQANVDTTSHNFFWSVDTIGIGSSVLMDAAVINENDIWAVGEIHTRETDRYDSLGNWVPPYNAVHWDGQQWELKRILYKGGFWDIRTVFAFDKNDVLFEAFVKWSGTSFIQLPIPDILIGHGINKIWGTSSNDLYVVGSNGLIAHYSDQQWHRIESGTDLPIRDIWGAINPVSKELEILCVASEKYQNVGEKILRINGDLVESIPDSGLSWSLSGIWFVPSQFYFIVGAGVYRTSTIGTIWKRDTSLPYVYTHAIRGQGMNDIIVVGAYGLVLHYNGVSWYNYTGKEVPSFDGIYISVCYERDIVVAVGNIAGVKAIILKGIRK